MQVQWEQELGTGARWVGQKEQLLGWKMQSFSTRKPSFRKEKRTRKVCRDYLQRGWVDHVVQQHRLEESVSQLRVGVEKISSVFGRVDNILL